MSDKHADTSAEQETRPLEMETVSSALAFRQYVQDYQLSLLDVALTARVRYMTLWNMAHGLPIRPAQAAYVRMGLQKLTGVAYTASIVITSLDTGTNS